MYIPGTKNVAKELQKISQGANKWEGVNWFQQLSDKRQPTCLQLKYMQKCVCGLILCTCIHVGKSTKVHMYWAMKNCDSSSEDLRQKIMNTSKHYQVIFTCTVKFLLRDHDFCLKYY